MKFSSFFIDNNFSLKNNPTLKDHTNYNRKNTLNSYDKKSNEINRKCLNYSTKINKYINNLNKRDDDLNSDFKHNSLSDHYSLNFSKKFPLSNFDNKSDTKMNFRNNNNLNKYVTVNSTPFFRNSIRNLFLQSQECSLPNKNENKISRKIMAFDSLYKQYSDNNQLINSFHNRTYNIITEACRESYTYRSAKNFKSDLKQSFNEIYKVTNENEYEVNISKTEISSELKNNKKDNNRMINEINNPNKLTQVNTINNLVSSIPFDLTNNDLINNLDCQTNKNEENIKLCITNQNNIISSNINSSNNASDIVSELSEYQTNLFTEEGEIYSKIEPEKYFALFLEDIMIIYSKLEKMRETLNIDKGIYADDLYKFFDTNNDKSIHIVEFYDKLHEIGIPVTYEDLKLIYRRYDISQNLAIDYYEFSEMIFSINPLYRKIICDVRSTDDDDEINFKYFKKSFILKKFFKILIECETHYEKKRRKLINHPKFSIFDIFQSLKKDQENHIIQEDIKRFMEKHNIKANEDQMEILWDVIDINKKDKVTFEEFVDEFYPKINLIS